MPSPPQGEPGPKHVNVIIQMTEVTFNIGIIVLPVSHLYNLWLVITYLNFACPWMHKATDRDVCFKQMRAFQEETGNGKSFIQCILPSRAQM